MGTILNVFILLYGFGVFLAFICEKCITDMVKECLFENPDLEDRIDRSKLQSSRKAITALAIIAFIPFLGYLLTFTVLTLNKDKVKILVGSAIETINNREEEGNERKD
jgi:hypothetical protein